MTANSYPIPGELVSFVELMMWKEALASCAIEGNQYAREQLTLWHIDMESFISEYLRQKEIA